MHNLAMRSFGIIVLLCMCLFAVVGANSPSHLCCTQSCKGDGPSGTCDDNCLDPACCMGTPLSLPEPILLSFTFDSARLDSPDLSSAVIPGDSREIFHVPKRPLV